MLKYALMAVGAAIVVAIVFVMLPTGNGPRPEPRILTSGDAQPTNGFVIHAAPPPTALTPAPPAVPPAGDSSNLDVVMQRLRAGAAKPDATAAQTPDASAAPTVAPPAAAPVAPPPVVVPTPAPAPASQWSSVTAQGNPLADGAHGRWLRRVDRSWRWHRWPTSGLRPLSRIWIRLR